MDIVELITGNVRPLSHIRRFSSFPVTRPENVAEHTFYVAWYSWVIALDFEANGRAVDIADLLQKALAHDISEAVSGDIIRSYKHSSPQILEAMELADSANVEELLGRLDLEEQAGDQVGWCYRNAKNRSFEGAIIEFADMLCVVAYCLEEISSGNSHMRPVLAKCWGLMESKFIPGAFDRYMVQLRAKVVRHSS
jgi:5'-deoxynucleotidase YfbR-like HD superfamily hydrolase